MRFALSPEALRQGYRLVSHEVTASTNADALACARAGETGRLWIAATRQTGGRGRRGHAWSTPPGNLAASLLLDGEADLPLLATLGFVAGVALIEALDACCGPQTGDFALKWPNDVLAGGAKLAGILLETETLSPSRRAVVVGFGVNVSDSPDGVSYPATSLRALGCAVDPQTLFAALSRAWIGQFALWDGGRGFAAVRELWLRRAAGLGTEVSVETGRQVVHGVMETIDGAGQLVLRQTGGARSVVPAGDVHFGQAGTARRGTAPR